MRNRIRENWIFLVMLVGLSAFSLSGLGRVPFHPDESTQLYMSADFEALWNDPASLAWDPQWEPDARQRYRLLDAPLARYLIGFGRSLAGLEPLPVDWDWSLSWGANQAAGAYPGTRLLAAGRLAITLLLPITLALVYVTGRRLGGMATGIAAALLLGTHSLILLHARRAMAEGAQTFTLALFLFILTAPRRSPWLLGFAAGLAFCAKQSSLALLPIGLIAAAGFPGRGQGTPIRLLPAIFQYTGVSLVVIFALNPLLWSDPLAAVRSSWEARQELISRQVADTQRLAPGRVLGSLTLRSAALLANLYVIPPSFSEVGNYALHTAAQEISYLSVPGHNLLRGMGPGGVLIGLSLVGVILAIRRASSRDVERRSALILVLLATFFMTAALVIAVPLPWQRYVLPLVIFECLWVAYGIESLWNLRPNRQSRNEDVTKAVLTSRPNGLSLERPPDRKN